MKRLNFRLKTILLIMVLIILSIGFTSCMGNPTYDTPQYEKIGASQTAYVIPLYGNTTEQGVFASKSLLESHKVASKMIPITHKWVKTGRFSGHYVPAVEVWKVDRAPVVREWTDDKSVGTSKVNQAVGAESQESIAFHVNMTASAQVNEEDTSTFLYWFAGKQLDSIMDTIIKPYASGIFVSECSKYKLDELLLHKQQIMKTVYKSTYDNFKAKGITVTLLALKDDISYDNHDIQLSIDAKFKTEQDALAQVNVNNKVISKATADAKAVTIQASTIASQIALKKLELQSKALDVQMELAKAELAKGSNWKPSIIGDTSKSILNIPADILK